MSTPPDSNIIPATAVAIAIAGERNNRRSYRCYNCNYSFHITPIPTTSTPSPTSFRCPHCHHRHLIPHHVISSPPPPSFPPPSPPRPSVYSPQSLTFYSSDESDSDYDSDSDNSLLSFTTPNAFLSTPALKSFVDSLPIKNLAKNLAPAYQSCPICMESFEIENDSAKSVIVNELPCKHLYHKDCIVEWLNRSNTCPLCRFKLPLEPRLEEGQREPAEDDFYPAFTVPFEPAAFTVHVVPWEEPAVRRVVEEPGPSLGLNPGLDRLVVREGFSEHSRERNVRVLDAMRDEDGDTLMVDA